MSTKATGFGRVLAAEVSSNFGSMLSRLAIPWLAALSLDASPWQMGELLLADVGAGAIGGVMLAATIDRRGKRSVMLACDVLRSAVLGGAAALAIAHRLQFWMLLAAAAAGGLLTMSFELARSAWVALTVAPDRLAACNARLEIGSSLSEVAGFAAAGWLYQGLGAGFALIADAASYLVSAACLSGVPETRQRAAQATVRDARHRVRNVLAEAFAGIGLLASTPQLLALAGIEAFVGLGTAVAGTSYMIYVTRELGFGTGVLGSIFALGGLGSTIGALLATRTIGTLGSRGTIAAGLFSLTLGAVCVPLAVGATLSSAALLIAQQVVGDAGHTMYAVQDRTMRQSLVPGDALARTDAGMRASGNAATLLGVALGSWVGEAHGIRTALVLAAGCFAAATTLALLRLDPHRKAPPRESA
jgi:predicted MFS family arabinose efflux permease